MSRKGKDYSGEVYGRLTVIERNFERSFYTSPAWVCKCECGNSVTVDISRLRSGNTKSCGCLRREVASEVNTTHGMTNTPEYRAWKDAINRCHNPKNQQYGNYGARGITVSDEWRESFEVFYRDMGTRPSSEYSIDRKDNDKGYSAGNCRWATEIEQKNNTRKNVFYIYRGVYKTLRAWCRELELNYETISGRIRRGKSFEEAIS